MLEAARLTPDGVSDELGGLIPAKRHAAELAADALHRALGAAARAGALAARAEPDRTLVAMSGGVDSAAAAQLALDAGRGGRGGHPRAVVRIPRTTPSAPAARRRR